MEDDEVEEIETAMTTGTKINENIFGLLFRTQPLTDCHIENAFDDKPFIIF